MLTGAKVEKKIKNLLAGFTSTIAELESLNDTVFKTTMKNSEKAQGFRDKAEALVATNAELWKESEKIQKVADKLKKFIED